MKKKENKQERVLLFSDWKWEVTVISATTPRPITWKDTLELVFIYLSHGNGSAIRRITSVLMRLFTCSLKPKQVLESAKQGTTTSPDTSSLTE
jgi:hypothetical protein